MKGDMKEYALLITEYVSTLLVRGELKYFKDAAEHVKKGFEEEFRGTWHVISGINFGSHFSYETKCCILLYRSSIGFLIWKFG
jgi:dynein light chain LC8-type